VQWFAPLTSASDLLRPSYSFTQSGAAAQAQEHPQTIGRPPLIIKDIQVQVEMGVKEKVLVFSSRFIDPSVMALEGEKPRFVIDIRNTSSVKKGLTTIPVDGRFIHRIRTHHDANTGTFRIVLDLSPSENYKVNQTFFEAENLYVIEVEPEHKSQRK
jgi:hypothetical protein